MSRSDTWNRRAAPPVLRVHDAVALRQREDVALLPVDRVVADLAFAEPSITQQTEFAEVRNGSVVAPGSSCTRKQSISAIPVPPVSGLM